MNRTERLLDLITYLLNAREPVSWSQIKNYFPEDYSKGIEESNQRKFERDKAELITLGIPIDYRTGSDIGDDGYIIDKDKLFLPEVRFSPTELSLLMLAAEAVIENDNFPYREQLNLALTKFSSSQNPVYRSPEEIQIRYYSDDKTAAAQQIILDQIQMALDRRKSLKITYHAFSTGEKTDRTVYPYGLILRKGRWTLVGWDLLRQDIRAFVLTRVEDAEANQLKPGTPDYTIPDDFSLKNYQKQPWEIYKHPAIDVVIKLSEHRLNELLPEIPGAEKIKNSIYKLRVTNVDRLISWILTQKQDALILEPEEVKEKARQALTSLL